MGSFPLNSCGFHLVEFLWVSVFESVEFERIMLIDVGGVWFLDRSALHGHIAGRDSVRLLSWQGAFHFQIGSRYVHALLSSFVM